VSTHLFAKLTRFTVCPCPQIIVIFFSPTSRMHVQFVHTEYNRLLLYLCFLTFHVYLSHLTVHRPTFTIQKVSIVCKLTSRSGTEHSKVKKLNMFSFFNSPFFVCVFIFGYFTYVVRMCDDSEPFSVSVCICVCVCGGGGSKSMNPYHRDILGRFCLCKKHSRHCDVKYADNRLSHRHKSLAMYRISAKSKSDPMHAIYGHGRKGEGYGWIHISLDLLTGW
jgi:hypothetical protein